MVSLGLYEHATPLAPPLSSVVREALQQVQGNILRPHGRNHAAHLFVRFTAHPPAVRGWLRALAQDVTSAYQQLEESQRYRHSGQSGRVFVHVALSASGYTHLGLRPAAPTGFRDQAFLAGMKAAQHRLNDPPTPAWERGYRQRLDAMLLLADDQEERLRQHTEVVLKQLEPYAELCAIDYGHVLRNAQGEHIEHFGYVDGISQPRFFASDLTPAGAPGAQVPRWDVAAAPGLALVPDPYGRKGALGRSLDSGSFLVFRKLEQYVRTFKAREQALAQALGLSRTDAERAGALAVGRFRDGTPVVLQPTPGQPTNNFTYDTDPEGARCPLQAHIRKMNPRQTGVPQIVRRGISYGARQPTSWEAQSLAELPARGVGLLFMCYQASITRQFEFLQQTLANDPHYPRGYEAGIDPLIGQPGGSGSGRQLWPEPWGSPRAQQHPFDFAGVVKLQGGEYFFAPSLPFLRTV
ncbi:MAG: Dyp-type peroxidase [Candidatus Tectimicrobiota bacterium]